MRVSIRHSKDFWAGVFFLAVGVGVVIFGRRYAFGTAAHMGPGFFPTVLGALLAGLGIVIALGALRLRGERAPIGGLALRPVIAVLGSVVLFALLLRPLGLVASSILLVVLSSLGSRELRWREVAILAAALTLFSVLVFSVGLKLDLPVWPTLWQP